MQKDSFVLWQYFKAALSGSVRTRTPPHPFTSFSCSDKGLPCAASHSAPQSIDIKKAANDKQLFSAVISPTKFKSIASSLEHGERHTRRRRLPCAKSDDISA
jgi:hypothetical protein